MLLKRLACLVCLIGFAAIVGADDRLDARREQIAKLQPTEQEELLRKQERFAALPAEEQQRLRAFQAALDADKDAARLEQVLIRYHEWLKTLTPSQRAKLAELPPAERVAEIKRIKKQQNEARERMHRADLLSWVDMKEVLKWTEDFVWERRQDLLAEMSKEQRQRFEKWDRQRQRRAMLLRAFERSRREGPGAIGELDQTDIDKLAGKLSDKPKQALSDAATLTDKRRLVGGWIGTSMHRLDPWPSSRKQGSLVVEDLLQYLQNEVPPTDRERLLKMPRDKMLEELRGMYFERSRYGGPGGPPRFDGRPGDRPRGSYRGSGGRGSDSRSDDDDSRDPREKRPRDNATLSSDAPTIDSPATDAPATTSPSEPAPPTQTDAKPPLADEPAKP
jgi:hypothetical protein